VVRFSDAAATRLIRRLEMGPDERAPETAAFVDGSSLDLRSCSSSAAGVRDELGESTPTRRKR
jgi:hypothetical protein